ncbi:MAG TPA: cupin domain-containing protein [Chloroflexota bacterium]|nr:cupin domain-containing protein [Chloroflexota bacterium]
MTEYDLSDSSESPEVTEAGAMHGRVLAAPILRFDLQAELERLRRQPGYDAGKPTGKTLVKEPDLRIVLIALRDGAGLEEHQASGPISVQVIEGKITLRVMNARVDLTAGEIVALEAGVRHDVEAAGDAAFLLTIGRTTYEQVSDRHEPRF